MTTASSSDASRRELLVAAGVGMACSLGGNVCAAMRSVRATGAASDKAAELLDEALERIARRFPDQNIHRSNHAPMVAETLCVLGRADAIASWLDAHLAGFDPGPGASTPIDAARWREALGRNERYADWQAFFLRAIQESDWKSVLGSWVPRLAPGLAGVATHGVIRTAHGARALAARENAIRKFELATGLAYWAANYEELPWDGSLAPEESVAAALVKIEPRCPGFAPPDGSIVAGLRALNETPSFRPVAGLVEPADPARTLGEIASAFAGLYLRNPVHRLPFTHSITAPSALRLLAPYLDEESLRVATRYAWQAAAGLYVVYGDARQPAPAERTPAKPDAIIARAVETGGAHAIKLTEACLREEALSHDPVLLQAAQDAAEMPS